MTQNPVLSEGDLAPLLPGVAAFLDRTPTMLIDGDWVGSVSGELLEVEDPASGDVMAYVPAGDTPDVDAAVAAARSAFETGPWSRMGGAERAKLLWRLADLIENAQAELAQLVTLENGKPVKAATREVVGGAELLRYMAGWTTKLEGASIPIRSPGSFHVYTRREPVGVAGQIIPWNFPVTMATWKLAPALAAGCTVVLKPAEQTPLSALRIGELIADAGFPPGVVNIVTGLGHTAGAAIAAHPGVDKVAFTGSTEVGRLILHAAAGNLKKVTLELGGKSPNIICADADVEVAAVGAGRAIFSNSGQFCAAGSRLYVHESVYDDVLAGLVAAAAKLRIGPGLGRDVDMGPLVSATQFERVTGYIADGTAAGARAATGGNRWGERGYFVEPTVFTDVSEDMTIVREEIFGPVVTASPFHDLDEVARLANATPYGLGAGIWTRDLSTAHRLAARIKSGTVWVNNYGGEDPAVPFGGYKESGWGREQGREGVETYTQTKSVMVRL